MFEKRVQTLASGWHGQTLFVHVLSFIPMCAFQQARINEFIRATLLWLFREASHQSPERHLFLHRASSCQIISMFEKRIQTLVSGWHGQTLFVHVLSFIPMCVFQQARINEFIRATLLWLFRDASHQPPEQYFFLRRTGSRRTISTHEKRIQTLVSGWHGQTLFVHVLSFIPMCAFQQARINEFIRATLLWLFREASHQSPERHLFLHRASSCQIISMFEKRIQTLVSGWHGQTLFVHVLSFIPMCVFQQARINEFIRATPFLLFRDASHQLPDLNHCAQCLPLFFGYHFGLSCQILWKGNSLFDC